MHGIKGTLCWQIQGQQVEVLYMKTYTVFDITVISNADTLSDLLINITFVSRTEMHIPPRLPVVITNSQLLWLYFNYI